MPLSQEQSEAIAAGVANGIAAAGNPTVPLATDTGPGALAHPSYTAGTALANTDGHAPTPPTGITYGAAVAIALSRHMQQRDAEKNPNGRA